MLNINLKYMSRDAFFKTYSNLLDDVRKEIIVIIDNKTYSWDVAFIEIEKDTELGKRILKKLEEMELI